MQRWIKLITVLVTTILLAGCAGLSAGDKLKTHAIQPENNRLSASELSRMIITTVTSDYHESLTRGAPINPTPGYDEMGPPDTYLNFIADLQQRYGVTLVADWPLGSIGVRCLVFSIDNPAQRQQIISRLEADERIETAQPMQAFSVLGEIANDPYRKLQHHLTTLQVEQSHRLATGKGIKIAVIDTGTDTRHEDLVAGIPVSKNFVDTDNESFQKDRHGTAVSGVIIAAANNAIGTAGIAPDASVLAMKACWETEQKTGKAGCSSFTLAKAINVATSQNINIINLSLAGPNDPLLQRLLYKAMDNGVTVVAAVGQNLESSFPANLPGVLAVDTSESTISNPADKNILHAPGQQIMTTAPDNNYDFYSGSSLSTAQVSGLVALLKERNPNLTNAAIRDTLQQSTGSSTQNDKTTINACRALSIVTREICEREAR
jgi:hypothetical protein